MFIASPTQNDLRSVKSETGTSPGGEDLNVSGSYKHFAPSARGRKSAKYPTVCERCVTALDEIEKEAD
jgi:hypothetical protein